jgi:large subunit ribosomal protein L19e
MDLKVQRRIAARILRVGVERVKIKPEYAKEVKNALTAEDIRELIRKGYIYVEKLIGQSRGRARVLHEKKKKGRRRGHGSRKGAIGARVDKKREWINKVRKQRRFLKFIKDKIPKDLYRKLYLLSKGGYFRSLRHLKDHLRKSLAARGIKLEIK